MAGANLAFDMFHPSVVHHMFPSMEALYRLHGENILPAMKAALEDWLVFVKHIQPTIYKWLHKWGLHFS